ncbi:hypothetical protein ACX800_10055 [Paenarthrobacter nitroguajacolicus]|uniref:hypothetical protein n=1 Tax=Paenarthrobacter nitroguajacolicus TaxID=211146 RepID=UPI003D262E96
MNPTVILALISDLYNQNALLGEQNTQLQTALAEKANVLAQLTAHNQKLEAQVETLKASAADISKSGQKLPEDGPSAS